MNASPAVANRAGRGRWRQFGLGTFLGVLTVGSVLIGPMLYRAQRQKNAVAAIRAAGGSVGYDYQFDAELEFLPGAEPPSLSQWFGEDVVAAVTSVSFIDSSVGYGFTGGPVESFVPPPRSAGPVPFAQIGRLDDLKLLLLDGVALPRDAGPQFARLTNLEALTLSQVRFDGSNVEFLKNLSALRRFYFVPDASNSDQDPEGWARFGDRELGYLANAKNLEVVELFRSNVTDEGLAHLANAKSLRRLEIGHSRVRGPGLRHLAALSELRVLDLNNTQLDERGLKYLGELTQLQDLWLNGVPIAGAELEHLRPLQQLEELDLTQTGVTDAAIPHLKELKHLRYLLLVDDVDPGGGDDPEWTTTKISPAGIAELKRALPNCKIRHLSHVSW